MYIERYTAASMNHLYYLGGSNAVLRYGELGVRASEWLSAGTDAEQVLGVGHVLALNEVIEEVHQISTERCLVLVGGNETVHLHRAVQAVV